MNLGVSLSLMTALRLYVNLNILADESRAGSVCDFSKTHKAHWPEVAYDTTTA